MAGADCSTTGSTVLLSELLRAGTVPDAVALRDGACTMTYRELDEESSRWARELLSGGAGPGEFVVAALPCAPESALALWAVAKAGACFVPVAPTEPSCRIAKVIADSGARQGITLAAVKPKLPRTGIDWLMLDDAAAAGRAARRPATPIEDIDRARALRPDHPAYLLYPSTTTDTPKPILITHRALDPDLDHHSVLTGHPLS